MSIEMAEQFLTRLKRDERFREMISQMGDAKTVKTFLLCQKLIFSEQELISAVLSEIMTRENILLYVKGWKFQYK